MRHFAMCGTDRALREYARLAFRDICKRVDSDGIPLPVHQIDNDTAASLAGLDVMGFGKADVGEGQILKFKLASRDGRGRDSLCT